MSIVRNIELYESGQQKIDWVKAHMPVLHSIEKDFSETKPFAGKKVALSIHLEAKKLHIFVLYLRQVVLKCMLQGQIP